MDGALSVGLYFYQSYRRRKRESTAAPEAVPAVDVDPKT